MNKKLQVFVSSTYTDLIEERQAAVEAILDAGHIPAGMELFKAGKSQMETIRKWIDDSDVYMLILGGRYGSIEDDSGLSFTHLEYEYALSKNMPVFAIVLDDSFLYNKATVDKNTIFEKDNIDKYTVFKQCVESNIVKFVNNIDQITSNVHSQLNTIVNDPDYNLRGWVHNNNKSFANHNHININKIKTLIKLLIYSENIKSDTDKILHNQNDLMIYAKDISYHIQEMHQFYINNRPELELYNNELEKIFSNYDNILFELGISTGEKKLPTNANGKLVYDYFIIIHNSSSKLINTCNDDILNYLK